MMGQDLIVWLSDICTQHWEVRRSPPHSCTAPYHSTQDAVGILLLLTLPLRSVILYSLPSSKTDAWNSIKIYQRSLVRLSLHLGSTLSLTFHRDTESRPMKRGPCATWLDNPSSFSAFHQLPNAARYSFLLINMHTVAAAHCPLCGLLVLWCW